MRALIVTRDLVGPVANGGIGTACTALTEFLASEKNDVDILFTLGEFSQDNNFEYWQRYYKKVGANLIPVRMIDNLESPPIMSMSYNVYRWLKNNGDKYDVIYAPEWGGGMFYSMLAKAQGLILQNTQIVIGVHSPTSWVYEGNRTYLDGYEPMYATYMEKTCLELADEIVYPSHHMKEWVAKNFGIKRGVVIQNIMPSNAHEVVIPDGESPEQQVVQYTNNTGEVCFFGRFTPKKGADVFAAAMGLVTLPLNVTMMGAEDFTFGGDFSSAARQMSKTWDRKVLSLLTDKDQKDAIKYLKARKPLVVMGSVFENLPYSVMECIGLGLPILVPEHSGGTLELFLDPEPFTYKRNPEALAAKIEELMGEDTIPVPTLAEPQWRVKKQWRDIFKKVTAYAGPVLLPDPTPDVSVCMAHYNRPDMLEVGLKSLRKQTYKGNIEIVVCDDHSEEENFQQLEQFQKDGLIDVLLRNENNMYLGYTRNQALNHSSGELILIMDDDNVAKPEEIETLVRALLRTGSDAVTVSMDKFTGDLDPHYSQQLGIGIFLGGSEYCGLIKNVLGDANALYRRDSIMEFMYTEDYGIGFEDWELLVKMTLAGKKVTTCPEPLYYYRVHPDPKNSMLMSGPDYLNMKRMLRVYEEQIGGELGKYIPEYLHGLQKTIFGMNMQIRWMQQRMQGGGGAN